MNYRIKCRASFILAFRALYISSQTYEKNKRRLLACCARPVTVTLTLGLER